MKKAGICFALLSLLLVCQTAAPVFAQEASAPSAVPEPSAAAAAADDAADAISGAQQGSAPAAVKAHVPAAKRPKSPDSKKTAEAEKKDSGKNTVKDNRETIKYGIESDILTLFDTLMKNDDPRFMEEAYDLFQVTQNETVKKKLLAYFSKMEDPCLEDYAVTMLNDPYDESDSLVTEVFKYTAAVKCKDALPAVMELLQSDNETYFNNALTTAGEIGGEPEAKVIAGFLDREDLSVPQRQNVVKVLGKLKAKETVPELTTLAQDTDETSFTRAYAAQALGEIGVQDSLKVLESLFGDPDPIVRQYVISGIKHYPKSSVQNTIIQGIKDGHYRVRLEAIKAADSLKIADAVPYLVYRAKHDPEGVVKEACYPVIAKLNTSEGNEYLSSVLKDKKASDSTKAKVCDALFEADNVDENTVFTLAEECLKDDKRKPLRYAIGKLFVKYARPQYGDMCGKYLVSKDAATVGTGLDIFAAGKYSQLTEKVKEIAANDRAGANQRKAKHILGIDDE